MERLTELEGAVLGVVWERGPCTPYAVRHVFLDSPSPYWSGSAGAIYPLMQRLERQGRIASKKSSTGRRRRALYMLTPAGRRAFRAWLRPPWPAVVTGVPADPLRTRVSFLGALPAWTRARFLKQAVERIASSIPGLEKDRQRQRRAGNLFEAAVARGAVGAQLARRRWLDGLRTEMRRRR